MTGGGRILSDSQTVYALALAWDLLETPEQQRRAAARLADLVRVAGFRIATGFVGTPLVADALSRHGHSDVAYRLLLQTECPSWLYPVTMGATTVWERWDSMLSDGSINPGQMTSFNHYALGAVADWLHRRVAGLAPLEPGYRQLLIAPLPHVSLTSAGARHVGPYGEASVEWQLEGPSLTVHATVPVGVQAEVRLPGVGPFLVEHGTFTWTSTLPVRVRSPRPSVRQAMDDAETWSVITHAVLNCGLGGMGRVDDEQALAKRLEPYLDAAVSDIPAILTLGGNDPGLDRMVELLGGLAER